jgi:hypothetical protein
MTRLFLILLRMKKLKEGEKEGIGCARYVRWGDSWQSHRKTKGQGRLGVRGFAGDVARYISENRFELVVASTERSNGLNQS